MRPSAMRHLLAALAVLGPALLCHPAAALAGDRWFTTSDGVRLHYTDQGRGGTLVFVPGWTMPGWIWTPQISAFASAYRVVAFDPRAQGDSDVAARGYEPHRRGQDIAELIAQLGPERVVLVGWSLGVLDALAYVHDHGDGRVAGLVLVDNSVGEDPPPAPSRSSLPPRRRRRAERPLSREDSMARFVRGMFERPQSAAYLARLTDATLRTPAPAAAALLAYPEPRTYWREAVYATRRPVLYVVRPRLAGQAANLQLRHPQAESVVMTGVGHALFVDDAAGFNAVMDSFLRRRVWP